jgi:hypothetical protein
VAVARRRSQNGIGSVNEYTESKSVWVELTGGTRDPSPSDSPAYGTGHRMRAVRHAFGAQFAIGLADEKAISVGIGYGCAAGG